MKSPATKATLANFEPRLTLKERSYEGVISYDIDNNYPKRVRQIIGGSSIGASAIQLYRRYIYGQGFQDQNLSNFVVNRWKLTADKMLRGVADDFAYCGGFALHFNYNLACEKTDISITPIEHLRICTNDSKHSGMYAIYKEWDAKRINKEKIKYVDRYNPDPRVILAQIEKAGGIDSYNGQIMLISNMGNGYPVAIYDSALEDMITDYQSKIKKNRDITTNFMASHLLITSKIESEDNKDTERSNLIETLVEFQGAENTSKIAVIEKETPDQEFDLRKVEQQNGDRNYEYTETSVRNNIREVFMIPPVLLNNTPSKLGGSTTEIIDAMKSYNIVTEDERYLIEEVMKEVFNGFPGQSFDNFFITPKETMYKDDAINKDKIVEIVKDTALTREQKQNILINVFKMNKDDVDKLINPSDAITSEQTLSEKLGVGGTQSMKDIISDPNLTPNQKRGTLKVLFSLNDDQINTIIPQENVDNAE